MALTRSRAAVVLVLAVLAGGCGGSGQALDTHTTAASLTPTPTTTTSTSHAATTAQHHVPPARPLATSKASPSVVQPQPPPHSCHARGSGLLSLPDPRCTPGSINPAVTQANIYSTICVHGYIDNLRPSKDVIKAEKKSSLAAYGITASPLNYEYDHLVPLELGGASNDPRNLWPEPGQSPNPKDQLEDYLHVQVCFGQMTLSDAQHLIAGNWVAAYRQDIG